MLRCKEEADAVKEEPASPSAGAAKEEPATDASMGAAMDFLATFGGGQSFDALVAAAEPHAASAQLQQAFAERLEDLAESPEEWEEDEVHDTVKEEAKKEQVPRPWRREKEQVPPPRYPWREPAASSASATVGTGLLHIKASRETAKPTEPPLKMETLPESGPSAFSYGP